MPQESPIPLEIIKTVGLHTIALDLASMKLSAQGNEMPQDIMRQLLLEAWQRLDAMSEAEFEACLNNSLAQVAWVKRKRDSRSTSILDVIPMPSAGAPQLVYWRNEVSGQLVAAVERFLSDEPLEAGHLKPLIAYLRIWAHFPGWSAEDKAALQQWRDDFDSLVANGDRNSIQQWLNAGLQLGIDPL